MEIRNGGVIIETITALRTSVFPCMLVLLTPNANGTAISAPRTDTPTDTTMVLTKASITRRRPNARMKLSSVNCRIPALRERPDDIPLLAEMFVDNYCKAYGFPAKRLTRDAKRLLKECDWPGNVRQLENVRERLCCMVDASEITLEDVRGVLLDERSLQPVTGRKARLVPVDGGSQRNGGTLRDLSDSVFWRVAAEEEFRPTRIARRLGISRTTVWRKLKSGQRGTAAEEGVQ